MTECHSPYCLPEFPETDNDTLIDQARHLYAVLSVELYPFDDKPIEVQSAGPFGYAFLGPVSATDEPMCRLLPVPFRKLRPGMGKETAALLDAADQAFPR